MSSAWSEPKATHVYFIAATILGRMSPDLPRRDQSTAREIGVSSGLISTVWAPLAEAIWMNPAAG